ncbi:MAG: hypothetical protein A4S09_06395 [Proteobacteria bacterium SG_bin7]|nr:MAG: hypothetical protein A4S09_06395 [Proteobacteria bacterium SG_bin7]
MKHQFIKMQFLTATISFLTACGHSSKHGSIAMKESDTLAHVSIHNVKIGDSVTLYENVCTRTNGERPAGSACRRREKAAGVVTKIFNEHYSLVEFPPGTKVAEGDFVETVKK